MYLQSEIVISKSIFSRSRSQSNTLFAILHILKIKFGVYEYNNYICTSNYNVKFQNLHFMDLVSRLKQYLDSRQISVTQFADECSIPRPTGSQLLAGRNKKVSDEIISKIHTAYPDLSIVWLMFGEGDMVTGANIEISEPQKPAEIRFESEHQPEVQTDSLQKSYIEQVQENSPEKIHEIDESSYAGNTFSFSSNPPASQSTPSNIDISSPSAPSTSENGKDSITVTPGKGKRVTGIVVYYDDSTYESFIPDPNHRHPFMR